MGLTMSSQEEFYPMPFFATLTADQLPMTDQDWELAAWAMQQVRLGAWGPPRMVTFELGGVNGLYEAVADKDVLAAQIPRLYTLVKDGLSVVQWNEPI